MHRVMPVGHEAYAILAFFGILPSTKPSLKRHCTRQKLACVFIPFIGLSYFIFQSLGYAMSFLQKSKNPCSNVDFFRMGTNIGQLSSIARGYIVLTLFLLTRSHLPAVHSAISHIIHAKLAKRTLFEDRIRCSVKWQRKCRWAVVLSAIALIVWECIWTYAERYVYGKMGEPSLTFRGLGIQMSKDRAHIVWLAFGVFPYYLSLLINVLQMCFGLLLQEATDFLKSSMISLSHEFQSDSTTVTTLSDKPKRTMNVEVLNEATYAFLDFHKKLHILAKSLNAAFGAPFAAAFFLDMLNVFSHVMQIQEHKKTFSWLDFGESMSACILYATFVVIFVIPYLKIHKLAAELPACVCSLKHETSKMIELPQGLQMKALLDILTESCKQRKLWFHLAGITPLNTSFILKTFTLTVSIWLIARELTTNDTTELINILQGKCNASSSPL